MSKLFIFSLFLLLLSFQGLTQEGIQLECAPSGAIKKLSETILNVAAPLKDCPTDKQIDDAVVIRDYEKFYGGKPQVTKKIKGFNLKGSEKELQLANLMLGARPPKQWADAAKSCSTIQCAFEKLLNSKVAAMEIFNFAGNSSYVLSLDQTINQGKVSEVWTPGEIREMAAAASKMPKQLQKLPHLKVVTRMANGYRKADDSFTVGAYAMPELPGHGPAELVIYDRGRSRGISSGSVYDQISWPQHVLMHETCHHYDFKGIYASNFGNMTTEQKGSTFSSLSGWKEKVGKRGESTWVSNSNAQFVSAYASTQPAEDFAETCANYILDPHHLAKVAPSKYAYMKNKVFAGEEFKDKPWANLKDKQWPELSTLLASQEGCSEALGKCVKDMSYNYGKFTSLDAATKKTSPGSSMTLSTFGSALDQINKNHCMNDFINDRIEEIDNKLSSNDNYCDKGGRGRVEKGSAEVCSETKAHVASQIEKAVKVDATPFVTACESEKDYTKECIIKKTGQSFDVPKGMIPVMESLVLNKAPKRMSALGENLDAIGTSKWLKSCVKEISSFQIFRTTNGGNIIDYKSSKEGYEGSYWVGRNLWENYDKKDVSMACAENLLGLYQESGFKVPKGENPINLIKKPFGDEMISFEKEVLFKVGDSISKCYLKNCKRKKIMELLSNWEKQSPEKRSGMADTKFVEELLEKIKVY